MLLKVPAAVYEKATSVRNAWYDSGVLRSYSSELPVVSIGNLTVGGSGKTPLCAFLVAALRQRGYSPVVLTRGYGGSLHGPHLVQTHDLPQEVGDEPLLLAFKTGAPVVVSRDRVRGCRFLIEQDLGDVVVLDDGFQHRRLRRCVDIVTIDVSSPYAVRQVVEGQVLPAGILRENRDSALSRASTVVFSHRKQRSDHGQSEPDTELGKLRQLVPTGTPTFDCWLEAVKLRGVTGGALEPPAEVAAFCGIAGPDAFFQTLERAGFKVRNFYPYRDHHRYRWTDIARMQRENSGFPLVCTEKDAVKLHPNLPKEQLFVLEVSARVEPEEGFVSTVCSHLS